MTAYVWKKKPKMAGYVNLTTPEEIRNTWCFGLPLTREDQTPVPDTDIEIFIANAVADAEKRLGTSLKPIKILCNPDTALVKGTDYDAAEMPYDYDFNNYVKNWNFIQLRKRPAISVQQIVFKFPDGQQIFGFPKEWIKLYNRFGQVQIVPYSGFSTVLSTYPMFMGFMGQSVPQLIWIDYTAGFDEIPDDIGEIIAKRAACDVLGIAGEALLAGIASLSTGVDGLSESFGTTASATNTTYGAHVLQYHNDIKEFWDKQQGDGKGRHMGIRMTGV
jgi:hypothetical protein